MATTLQTMGTGPDSSGKISNKLLVKFGMLSSQDLVEGLWVMG